MQRFSKIVSILLFIILVTGLMPATTVFAQSAEETDLSTTIEYLRIQVQPDGGFPGLSEGSDPGTTARALIAFHTIGVDPADFQSTDGLTPVGYLLNSYPSYIVDANQLPFPGNVGLVLLALSLHQAAPDGLSELLLSTLQEDGSFSSEAAQDWNTGIATDLSQSLAILGLVAHGDAVPSAAVDYLVNKQLDDATWDNGFGSDPDTTAMVVIALLSSGQVTPEDSVIQKAMDYFRSTQLDNAGWRPLWDSSNINVDTTGWISLALITAGEDLADWQKDGETPRTALLTMLQENGSIGGEYVNVYSTVEALLAFADAPLFPVTATDEENSAEDITNQAGLVVTMPDGSTVLRCIAFTGESISGYDLLTTSGLQLETSFDPSKGNAVCGIEGQGCGSDNCFCGMPDYWSYWHQENGEWIYSQAGANTYEITAKTVDGWSWGDQPPVTVTFDQICAEDAQLFLPAVIKESEQEQPEPETTQEILIPLVQNAGNPQDDAQEADKQPLNQYLIFGVIALALIIALVFLMRDKRKA